MLKLAIGRPLNARSSGFGVASQLKLVLARPRRKLRALSVISSFERGAAAHITSARARAVIIGGGAFVHDRRRSDTPPLKGEINSRDRFPLPAFRGRPKFASSAVFESLPAALYRILTFFISRSRFSIGKNEIWLFRHEILSHLLAFPK